METPDLMQTIATALATTAAIVGALAALGTLGLALTRRTRLRRAETQWRQILELGAQASPGSQRPLICDLHRHTVAQLVGLDLASHPLLRGWGWLGFGMSAAAAQIGWWLSEIPNDPQGSHQLTLRAQLAYLEWAIAGLILVSFFLTASLTFLVGQRCASNRMARDALRGSFPITRHRPSNGLVFLQAQQPERNIWWLALRTYAIGAALTVASAASGVFMGPLWNAWVQGHDLYYWSAVTPPILVVISGILIVCLAPGLAKPSPPELTSFMVEEVEPLSPAKRLWERVQRVWRRITGRADPAHPEQLTLW